MTQTQKDAIEIEGAALDYRLTEVREALKSQKNRFSKEQLTVLYRYRRMLIQQIDQLEARKK